MFPLHTVSLLAHLSFEAHISKYAEPIVYRCRLLSCIESLVNILRPYTLYDFYKSLLYFSSWNIGKLFPKGNEEAQDLALSFPDQSNKHILHIRTSSTTFHQFTGKIQRQFLLTLTHWTCIMTLPNTWLYGMSNTHFFDKIDKQNLKHKKVGCRNIQKVPSQKDPNICWKVCHRWS